MKRKRFVPTDWSKYPVEERPRFIAYSLAPYMKWRYLRWYLLLLVPVMLSTAAFYLRGGSLFKTVGTFVLGAGISFALFTMLCSGIDTSNWGTYFRSTEPIRYWIGVCIVAVFYVLFGVIFGYLEIVE